MSAASDLAAFFDQQRLALAQSVGLSQPTIINGLTNYGMTEEQRAVPAPVPQYVQAQVTTYPTAAGVSPSVNSAKDTRIKEMNSNAWSNDTTVATLEKKSWAIYVETGRWDSPEQTQYHDQSEEIRKGLNPMYPGNPWGAGENKFILPTDQFVQANGMDSKGLLTVGALGLGAIVLLSMVRG